MKTTKKSVYCAPDTQVVKCSPVEIICQSGSGSGTGDVEEGYVKPVDDVSFKA